MGIALGNTALLEAHIRNANIDKDDLNSLKETLITAVADRLPIIQNSVHHRMDPDMPKGSWGETVAALNAAVEATTIELNERIKLVDKASKFFEKIKNNPAHKYDFGEYGKIVAELDRDYDMLNAYIEQIEDAA